MTTKWKCPRCKQQTARLTGCWAKDGRHYQQKVCNCGYQGTKKYMSLEASNRLKERLTNPISP